METNVTTLRGERIGPEPLRLPPANTDAEQRLLGAMLINNAAYGRVAEFLQAEHFSSAVHGRI
ncbi:MAG: DnaB-like helicase N-terminal domain-containing protein, partial [Stellaceae bacterium]